MALGYGIDGPTTDNQEKDIPQMPAVGFDKSIAQQYQHGTSQTVNEAKA